MTSLLTAYYSAALLFLLAHSTHIGLPPALQAKEEETSQQIAALSAELKKTQWEKTVIEQRAETLSTALAVRASTSSKVHCHSLHSSRLYNLRCCSSHLHPQDYGSCTLAVDLQHVGLIAVFACVRMRQISRWSVACICTTSMQQDPTAICSISTSLGVMQPASPLQFLQLPDLPQFSKGLTLGYCLRLPVVVSACQQCLACCCRLKGCTIRQTTTMSTGLRLAGSLRLFSRAHCIWVTWGALARQS